MSEHDDYYVPRNCPCVIIHEDGPKMPIPKFLLDYLEGNQMKICDRCGKFMTSKQYRNADKGTYYLCSRCMDGLSEIVRKFVELFKIEGEADSMDDSFIVPPPSGAPADTIQEGWEPKKK